MAENKDAPRWIDKAAHDKAPGWFVPQQATPGWMDVATHGTPLRALISSVLLHAVVASDWMVTSTDNSYELRLRLKEPANLADLTDDGGVPWLREYVASILELTARKWRDGDPFAAPERADD